MHMNSEVPSSQLAAQPGGPRRRDWLVLAAAMLSLRAHALDRPAGPVLLSVTGRVRNPNAGTRVDFDMAMLEALAQSSFSTRTPWFAQVRRFTGPLLRDVLATAGAQGQQLRLIALNDYQVEMPVDDCQRYDVIVARLLDGQPMAVRDKGPLLVVYPFDAQPELRGATYYTRSAWQLRTIDVS
jgi:hypothetical protein